MARTKEGFHFVIDHSNAEIFREMNTYVDNEKHAWIDVIPTEGKSGPELDLTLLVRLDPSDGMTYHVVKTLKLEGYYRR